MQKSVVLDPQAILVLVQPKHLGRDRGPVLYDTVYLTALKILVSVAEGTNPRRVAQKFVGQQMFKIRRHGIPLGYFRCWIPSRYREKIG